MRRNNVTILRAILMGLFVAPCLASAQTATPKLDLGITFIGDRTNPVNGSNSWLTGGGIELGVDAWHGLGIAADVQGLHTSVIGPQNIGVDLVSVTFGPRYRYTKPKASKLHSVSIFGEALLGEANAFNSFFPSPAGGITRANSLALNIGGGIDLGLSRRFAIRAVQANWLRTQLPNAAANIQNHLQLCAGLVVRF
jgi:hypothetical protein